MWWVIKQASARRRSTDYKPESVGFCPCYAKNCWVPLVLSVTFPSSQLLYLLNVGLGEVIPKIPSGLPLSVLLFTEKCMWGWDPCAKTQVMMGSGCNPWAPNFQSTVHHTLWPPIYFLPLPFYEKNRCLHLAHRYWPGDLHLGGMYTCKFWQQAHKNWKPLESVVVFMTIFNMF